MLDFFRDQWGMTVELIHWLHELSLHNPFAFATLTGVAFLGICALFTSDRGPTC